MSKLLDQLLKLEAGFSRRKANIVDFNILQNLREASRTERLANSEEITCIVCRVSAPRSLAFLIKNREIHNEALEECFEMITDSQDLVECEGVFEEDPLVPADPEVIARARNIYFLLKKGRFPNIYRRALHLPPSLAFSTKEEALAFFINAPRDDVASFFTSLPLNGKPHLWTFLLDRPEVGRWLLEAHQLDFIDEKGDASKLVPEIGVRLALTCPQNALMARSFQGAAAALAFLGMYCSVEGANRETANANRSGFALRPETVSELVNVHIPQMLHRCAEEAGAAFAVLQKFDATAAQLDSFDQEVVRQRADLALKVGSFFSGICALELFLMGAQEDSLDQRIGGANWSEETANLREKFANPMRMAAVEILKLLNPEEPEEPEVEVGAMSAPLTEEDEERFENGRDITRGEGLHGAYRDVFDSKAEEDAFYAWQEWIVDYESLDSDSESESETEDEFDEDAEDEEDDRQEEA